MGVSKNMGKPPKSSHLFIGFSIIFTIHFGIPLFLETPILSRPFFYKFHFVTSEKDDEEITEMSHTCVCGRKKNRGMAQLAVKQRSITEWYLPGR